MPRHAPVAVHLRHRSALRPGLRRRVASGQSRRGWTTEDLPDLLDGVELVVVRILGGYRDWQDGFDLLRAAGRPLVVVGGEQSPDAELMALSTVPAGVATQSHAYLAHGGARNLEQLHRFLADTLLLTGHGFEPPTELPAWGHLESAPDRF